MRESSTYQAILQEGIAVGRVEGIVQGRTEGRTEARNEGRNEGRVEGLRRSLIMLLEQKFGRIPQEIEQNIQACADTSRIESAIRQTLTIGSIAELSL